MAREAYITRFLKDTNLVSYWRMEGNSNDEKGAHNGTDTAISYGTSYGIFGQGANFNGTTSFINIGSYDNSGVISISIWVKTSSLSARQSIFGNFNSAGTYQQYGIDIETSGAFRYVIGNAGSTETHTTATGLISTGKWYNIIITRVNGSTDPILYLNGVQKTATKAGSVTTPTSNFGNASIGRAGDYSGSQFTIGNIDEVLVFNRVLTASEAYEIAMSDAPFYTPRRGSIATFFKNDPSLRFYTQLNNLSAQEGNGSFNDALAWWKLEDTSDSSGNGKTLTNNNTVTFAAGKFSNGSNHVRASNQYLSIADNFGITGGVISLSCWGKIASQPGTNLYYTFFSQGDATNNVNYEIWYGDDAGTKSLHFKRTKRGIADQGASLAITLNTGEWYHFVLTYDGTNVYMYLNGVLRASGAASGNGNAGNSNLTTIGSWSQSAPNHVLDGMVDNALIWNRVLTPQEIAAQYGNAILDNSGFNNNGNAVGGIFVPGLYGNAIKYNGSSEYTEIPNNVLPWASNLFSVMGWFKSNGDTAFSLFTGSDNVGAAGFEIDYGIVTGGQLNVSKVGVANIIAAYSLDGRWHHYCFVQNASGMFMYVDGKLFVSGSNTSNVLNPTNAPTIYLGARHLDGSATDGYFDGWIGETAVFWRGLSAQEIANYFNWATKQKRSTVGLWVTTAATYILALAQGSYALSGQVVNLLKSLIISLVQGSYTLTGQVLNFLRGFMASLAQGAYTLTGFDVALRTGIGYAITIAQGAYVLTGNAISVMKSLSMAIAQGAYTLSGQVMFLFKGWGMAMVKGTYALTGQAVMLSKNMYFTLAQGAYTLTGQALTMIRGVVMSLVHGVYTLTGKEVRAYLNGQLIGIWKKVGIATDRVWRKVSKNP